MKHFAYYKPSGLVTMTCTQGNDTVPAAMTGTEVIEIPTMLIALDEGWNYYLVDGMATPVAITYDLVELKTTKWTEIKAERTEREFSTFEWDGSVFDCDQISTARINGAFSLALGALIAGQAYSIDWKLADNSVRTLSREEMIGVGAALGNHVKNIHMQADVLFNEIYAPTTTEESLFLIHWPT